MNEIKKYGKKCCEFLKMKKRPEIKIVPHSYVIEIAKDEDTKACYDRKTDIVYISEKDEYDLEDFYVLSHELRHAWQNKTDPELFFADYYEQGANNQYHNILAEIDANAFACIAIAVFFGKVVKRTYKTDPKAQKLYKERLELLKREYEIDF